MKTYKNTFPILISLPGIIITTLFIIFPLLYNFYFSLHEKQGIGSDWTWVGFDNYTKLIGSEEFISAFYNGLIYAVSSVFIQIILGLFLALFLNDFVGKRYKKFFTGILIFPYLITTAIAIIVWKWMLSSDGIINYILVNYLQLVNEEVYFLSEGLAMVTLVFISVWQFFPFVLVMFLAGLQTIDKNLYKAAKIDGANYIQRLIYITLPNISNIVFTIILLRLLWMFTKFDTVYIMIGKTTMYRYLETLPVHGYRLAFGSYRLGMGAAVSFLLLLFLIVLTITFFRGTLFKKRLF